MKDGDEKATTVVVALIALAFVIIGGFLAQLAGGKR